VTIEWQAITKRDNNIAGQNCSFKYSIRFAAIKAWSDPISDLSSSIIKGINRNAPMTAQKKIT
jgi:hypothetical protein